jgi:hypothetical protein
MIQSPVQVSKTREELPTSEGGGNEGPRQSNPPLPNARPLTSSSMVDQAADASTDHGPRASGSRSLERNNEVRKLLYIFLSCLRNSIPFLRWLPTKAKSRRANVKEETPTQLPRPFPSGRRLAQARGVLSLRFGDLNVLHGLPSARRKRGESWFPSFVQM